MRVSEQFVLRIIADEHLLIPVGEAAIHVKGLIALSESGALIYNMLKDGCKKEDLVAAITAEYDVSAAEADKDVDDFLERMRQMNILVED